MAVQCFGQALADTASDDSGLAGCLSNVGSALLLRYKCMGRPADLDEAVTAVQAAVDATNNDHPDHASRLAYLGNVLGDRYRLTGAMSDLDESIAAGQAAVASTPPEHPNYAGHMASLAGSLQNRHERTGAVGDLDEAISAWQVLLAAAPAGHPDRGKYLSNLGNSLRSRFERTDSQPDLDGAIRIGREAVAVTPSGHPDRAGHLSNLAVALHARYQRTGAQSDLDETITVGRAALAALPVDHPDGGACLSNLAYALSARFARLGAQADLNEAVAVARDAIAATAVGHPNRGGRMCNLGLSLHARYERTGARSDLDEAVTVGRSAVAATPTDHPNRGMYLSNLGTSLQARCERTGSERDGDEAVAAGRAAVAATPGQHPGLAGRLANLGSALRDRYRRIGLLADLDEAISLGREALRATPSDHPDVAAHRSNLGNALEARFRRAGLLSDLDEAISLGRDSVTETPTDHPNLAAYLSNLGISLRVRYGRTSASEDLDEAVNVGRAAVTATPDDHPDKAGRLANYGNALRARYGLTGAPTDLDASITAARDAVTASPKDHPERNMYLSNLGGTLRDRYERAADDADLEEAVGQLRELVGSPLATPRVLVAALRALAELAWNANRDHSAAAHLLARAVTLLATQIAPRHLDWADQEYLLGEHAGLVGDAVAAHLQIGDVLAGVELAELGRGILLSYSLDGRSDLADLREAAPDLATEFEELLADLNSEPPSSAAPNGGLISTHGATCGQGQLPTEFETAARREWAQHRRDAVERHDALLTRIRSHSGLRRFLLPPTVTELSDKAAAAGPVVIVNVSNFRCDAIILRATQEPLPIRLKALAADEARRRAMDLLDAVQDDTLVGRKDRAGVIVALLAWLWTAITEPVLEALGVSQSGPSRLVERRMWWVPTGLLTALPLHAAALPDGPNALDYIVSSYSPTVRALTVPRQATLPAVPVHLVVAVPSTPALPRRSAAPDIPGTTDEADTITRVTGATSLHGRNATVIDVTAALSSATWAHLACHAEADSTAPSRSRLLLYDGDLTVPSISRLRLETAELAYLSACSTATGGLRQADEVITVATAFRLAGFRHVIGTLWPLHDDVAPRAARHFYELLPNSSATDTAAAVLHRTVQEIRSEHPESPERWSQLIHIGP